MNLIAYLVVIITVICLSMISMVYPLTLWYHYETKTL